MRHRPQRENGLAPSQPWRFGQPIALHSRRPDPSTSVTATTEKGVLDGPGRSIASTSSHDPQYVTFRPPSRFIVTAQCVAAARPSGPPVAKSGAVVGACRAHRGSRATARKAVSPFWRRFIILEIIVVSDGLSHFTRRVLVLHFNFDDALAAKRTFS